MSKKEVERADILARLNEGRLDAPSAAKMMGVSERHIFRLLRTFRKGGAPSLVHQHRGKRSNNRISDALKKDVLLLIRERYADLSPTRIAAELLDHHDIKLSRETIRSWMIEAGLWLPKAERQRIKRPAHQLDQADRPADVDAVDEIPFGNGIEENNVTDRKLLKRQEFSRKALDAAESLIIEDGLDGLNARKLAEAVGCSIGTLYNVYGNLDGIIQTLNARTLHRLHQALEEASRSVEGPEAQMIVLAHAYIDFAERQPSVWRAVFDHQPANEKAIPDWYKATINKIAGLAIDILSPLFQPAERLEAHRAATIIWSGVHGICALSLGGSLRHVIQTDSRRLAEELIHRHLAGLSSQL